MASYCDPVSRVLRTCLLLTPFGSRLGANWQGSCREDLVITLLRNSLCILYNFITVLICLNDRIFPNNESVPLSLWKKSIRNPNRTASNIKLVKKLIELEKATTEIELIWHLSNRKMF